MNICPNRLRALTWASLPMGSTTVTLLTTWVLCISSWAPRGPHLWKLSLVFLLFVVNIGVCTVFYILTLTQLFISALAPRSFFPWKNTQYPEATERQCQAMSFPQIFVFPGHSSGLCSGISAPKELPGPLEPQQIFGEHSTLVGWLQKVYLGPSAWVLRTRCLNCRSPNPPEATE